MRFTADLVMSEKKTIEQTQLKPGLRFPDKKKKKINKTSERGLNGI